VPEVTLVVTGMYVDRDGDDIWRTNVARLTGTALSARRRWSAWRGVQRRGGGVADRLSAEGVATRCISTRYCT
jgi:hypothetical protein